MNLFTIFIRATFITFLVSSFSILNVNGKKVDELKLALLEGEKWWGGLVVDGENMPFSSMNPFSVDLLGECKGNQGQPLLISSQGRYVWCEEPIAFTFTKDSLRVSSVFSEIKSGKEGATLRDAYLYCSRNFFPSNGVLPDSLLFIRPQYNTWIELMYNQNENDILKYARNIIRNGFPPGVLMIDDNWQIDYGDWEFKPGKFKDPKGMINELHEMGFKIMMWVCPFISADSEIFRYLKDKGYLLMNADKPSQAAIIPWWNGHSALLDFTNPEALDWFINKLKFLQTEYGVDGYKLDAGNEIFYRDKIIAHKQEHANKHTELYAKIGLNFSLNEYRSCWKMAGQPLVQRLRDKRCDWIDIRKLVPDMTTLGILGYAYGCPDMIGGGEYKSFLDNKNIDQELVVRSAQIHALMPMMQFSVAPWRILDAKHLKAVKAAVQLHDRFKTKILNLAKSSSVDGEPIVRPMEYEFPHQGLSEIKDQFMQGKDILVAPVTIKGAKSRMVVLPKGNWEADDGSVYEGGQTIEIEVPIERLPWFKKI